MPSLRSFLFSSPAPAEVEQGVRPVLRPGRAVVTLLGALTPVALAAALVALPGGSARAASTDPAVNPCLGADRAELLCPDLVMTPPYDLRLDRRERRGRVLLRAANSIDNLGRGPAELRGRRVSPNVMRARQRIVRRDGSRLSVDAGARLSFKPIPGQGRYWKFRDAARFELWRLDAAGNRVRRVRTGPKVVYCLRDLQRRNPMTRSPRRFVYPKCNQRASTRAVTLGTSVGWSDVYPAGYHEQWIDVTGLSGRFAFVHIADPLNGIHELDETNNEATTVVSLPSGRAVGAQTPAGPPGSSLGY